MSHRGRPRRARRRTDAEMLKGPRTNHRGLSGISGGELVALRQRGEDGRTACHHLVRQWHSCPRCRRPASGSPSAQRTACRRSPRPRTARRSAGATGPWRGHALLDPLGEGERMAVAQRGAIDRGLPRVEPRPLPVLQLGQRLARPASLAVPAPEVVDVQRRRWRRGEQGRPVRDGPRASSIYSLSASSGMYGSSWRPLM